MSFEDMEFDEINVIEKNVKHGQAKRGKVTREYHVWISMIQRCCNPNDEAYPRYGGRGITVCDEWRESFAVFKKFIDEKLGPKPSKNYTLDRKDNNKGYNPDNLQWATRKAQAENRRSSKQVVYKDRVQCLMQWATELNLPYHTIKKRILEGWTVVQAFETPIRKRAIIL